MDNICVIMSPELKEVYNKVFEKYPQECSRIGFNIPTFLGWIENYIKDYNKKPDFIPEAEALVNNAERHLNMEGKSFKGIPYQITYNYQGKKQTYNIVRQEGTSEYKIFNKDGKEVFHNDSKDRIKIFANLAVQQGRAVRVTHKNRDYIVNNRNQIISVTTGDEMKWGEENGDRKEILRLSQIAFREKQKAETATDNLAVDTINSEENRLNNNKEINYGKEFRRVQEESRKGGTVSRRAASLTEADRGRLADLLRRELESQGSNSGNLSGPALTYTNKKGEISTFNIRKGVSPQLFHDFFEVVRHYTENGELVDLHEDYSNCKCYLNEDGTCGFAIEPDGNLISVFNLGLQRGFLSAIKDFVITEGATHLDAYNSDKQPLKEIYELKLGAKTASSMDYNMEYDHDDIAKNHGNPEVVFMVMGKSADKKVEEKHFNKDQYDEAVDWQMANVDVVLPDGIVKSSIDSVNNNPVFIQFKKDIDLLAGYYEGGGRVLKDDLPNITNELDDKLNNYFMGGEELSINDYRNLWKLIEFYNDNKERRFREKKPISSSPSQAAPTNNFVSTGVSIGFTDTEMQEAARRAEQRRLEEERENKERPKSVAYESALDVKDNRIVQFKRTFSPQQIKDRGAMIADIFSDILDEAVADAMDAQLNTVNSDTATEEEKADAREVLSILSDPIRGRQYEAQQIGIPVIMKEIQDTIAGRMENADDELKPLYQNTVDFFKELFESQATLDIEEREGIRIIGVDVAEQTATDDENDESDTGNDEVGHYATGSDGWNFKVRYENPFNSLSKKVRSMLYDVYRPASEVDDLGQQRKYPMGQIYASILSYLAKNMQNSDDFLQISKDYTGKDNYGNDITEDSYPNGYPTFPVLEQMKDVYPWVDQIIQRLTDDYMSPSMNTNLRYPSTGGAMASQFYTNFRKAYIPYGKIQLGDNNFGITPLNYEMEDRVQYDKLEANYNNRMILSEHSVYNSDGKINKDNVAWLKNKIQSLSSELNNGNILDYIENAEAYNEGDPEIKEFDRFVDDTKNVLQSFGIEATQEGIIAYLKMENGNTLKSMLSDLEYITNILSKIEDSKIDEFNYILDTKNPSGEKLWSHFFDNRGMITDASYMQSFYDSASHKTKYSYSADNYLMKVFRGACMGTREQRRAYIDEHYGKYEWYRNQKTGEWRNKWLEYWYNYEGDQKKIPYLNIDNITEYSEQGTKIRPYSQWEPKDIMEVQNRSYAPDKKGNTGFYLSPIFSDSPMSMTLLGPKLSMDELLYGYTDSDGKRRQGALVSLVNQELWRIKLVQEREKAIAEGKIKEIANFDGNRGKQFCFIPELNNYRFEDSSLFIDKMLELKEMIQNGEATLADLEAAQITAITDCINHKMYGYNSEEAKKNPEKFALQYYNMTYANAAIIQMTTVDLAFYKNDTDFQKRFKEVYSGGIQLNTNSKYGKKSENVLIVADDIITSPNYNDIAKIIDSSSVLTKKEKENIKKDFLKINVADAQAIRAMHSFRSVLDMTGNWTDAMEESLNRFKKGTWTAEDYNTIYQIIKPFAYSVIERNGGVETAPSIPVPQQDKNSEICALMMYDLITNGLSNSPVYKAFSKFMNNSVDGNGEHLIDMIQFESAGKVGNQGVINTSFNPSKVVDLINRKFYNTKEGNEVAEIVDSKGYEFYTDEVDANDFLPNDIENAEANYYAIKHQMDLMLQDGSMPQEDYNKIIAYLRPTEDEIVSMLEQAALVTNPDGSKGVNAEVVHTIPYDNYYIQQPTPEHHIDAEATVGSQARNINVADLPKDFKLTLKGKYGNKVLEGSDAVIDFYYELLNENLIEDFFGVGNKQGLKGIFSSKENLRDAVTEIVRGNPKYGKDFAEALQIDRETGNFVLSPNSPTIFNLMQEIITSFFKNRITKQKINGAALIQAAGIGLDKDLRLRYDKDGKFLGAECYMPVTSKRLFEPLLETKVIDGKKVQVLNPEKLIKAGLDKAVGYRIPTENKSSMMPLIIKGFTPLQNGSAIVLPAEITTIAGSDFDVDKMYVMLTSFYVQNYDMKKAREMWARKNEIINDISKIFYNSDLLDEISDMDPEDFKTWFEENKEDFKLDEPRIIPIKYDFNKSPKENGRKARNNMVIQIMYNILTSKEGAESVFNPQGFKDVEQAAKVIKILTTPSLRDIYVQKIADGDLQYAITLLKDAPTKDLQKFIDDYSTPESPIYPQTFISSHAKNMAGMNQIGIYAIQGSMDAKYQRATTRLKPNQRFKLNNIEMSQVDVSDNGRRMKNTNQMVGASADNGKNPNLTDMGSTMSTAPMIGYMLRLGLSHLDAALLINQPVMVDSGFRSSYSYWADILGKNPIMAPIENISTETLIRGYLDPDSLSETERRSIAGICYRIVQQCEAQEYITKVSRADSPNGAMENSYAKARIQRYNVDLLQAKMHQRDFPFEIINEALSNTAVNTRASEETVREQLKNQRMGLLHGMYALGINSFNSLVGPYFFGAQKWFDDKVVKPILYNMNVSLPDATKAEAVDNIYKSYITYKLSSSPLFNEEEDAEGNKISMKDKRDFYLYSFPSKYQKILRENEDIRDLLSSFLQVKQFGNRKRIILQDVGSLSKGQKADVQRRLEGLIYSDNDVARELAKDLLIYSYFDNGLQFTHDSFSHLFTTGYLINFAAYTDTLNMLDEEMPQEVLDNFTKQFLITFPNVAFNAEKIITNDNLSDDESTITVDMNDRSNSKTKNLYNTVMSPNPTIEGNKVYPYIYYFGSVYVLDEEKYEAFPNIPTYHKLAEYSTFSKLPLFNIRMSVTEMSQEFPLDAASASEASPESAIAHNEGMEDPSLEVDAYIPIEIDSIIPDGFDMEDVTPDTPMSKSDKYTSEGTDELQDPMCN